MLIGILFFLLVLATEPSDAATKPAVPLRVAYSSISGSAIVPWIAFDKGFFAKYDLDVELIYVAASSQATTYLYHCDWPWKLARTDGSSCTT